MMEISKEQDSFIIKEEITDTQKRRRRLIWQIIPSVCGSTMCIPFGMMVGWPSATYPLLLSLESPIPITLDQSAAIAGFLMIGLSVATPLSSLRIIGANHGVCTGTVLMTIGWIMMWQASDVYWLFGSRFLVGIGFGFGSGQLKHYITEICEQELANILVKCTQTFTCIGILLSYSIAPFVAFKKFEIICVIISIFVLFLAIFLPTTVRELIKKEKIGDAKKLINFLNPNLNVKEEILELKHKINNPPKELNSGTIVIKDKLLRCSFFKFTIFVLLQQWVGFSATVVYSQVIFLESDTPYPHYCALVYILLFILSHTFGIFNPPGVYRKQSLLFSSVGVTIILLVQILVLYFRLNQQLWKYTFFILMLIYVVTYTLGFGNIPISYVDDFFPKEATKTVMIYFIIYQAMFALLITKIFQVLLDRQGIAVAFCLFFVVSVISNLFILIFIPNK